MLKPIKSVGNNSLQHSDSSAHGRQQRYKVKHVQIHKLCSEKEKHCRFLVCIILYRWCCHRICCGGARASLEITKYLLLICSHKKVNKVKLTTIFLQNDFTVRPNCTPRTFPDTKFLFEHHLMGESYVVFTDAKKYQEAFQKTTQQKTMKQQQQSVTNMFTRISVCRIWFPNKVENWKQLFVNRLQSSLP